MRLPLSTARLLSSGVVNVRVLCASHPFPRLVKENMNSFLLVYALLVLSFRRGPVLCKFSEVFAYVAVSKGKVASEQPSIYCAIPLFLRWLCI